MAKTTRESVWNFLNDLGKPTSKKDLANLMELPLSIVESHLYIMLNRDEAEVDKNGMYTAIDPNSLPTM